MDIGTLQSDNAKESHASVVLGLDDAPIIKTKYAWMMGASSRPNAVPKGRDVRTEVACGAVVTREEVALPGSPPSRVYIPAT
ncbi:hypothetical protein H257_16149 [Aphanomyces astaci]|uniref:Uncharacterized protein n=1 Tax=Aphanomyces astaci TaxID=112090 RepID=W4FLW7_APHAT|nr:hypothetical protein H257_16149 [Aphanomyces astaci]ETV67678.1 hypothetical protein H257_16149 [Aphanomyces astaci]|eukprot:XP_009842799.1 hypothetical protein H257_16149 [Aphanomyces astaci]